MPFLNEHDLKDLTTFTRYFLGRNFNGLDGDPSLGPEGDFNATIGLRAKRYLVEILVGALWLLIRKMKIILKVFTQLE